MKIFDKEALYDVQLTMKENCLIEIDMGKRFEVSLAKKFSKLSIDTQLLELLKTFNNKIIDVDTSVQQYIIDYDYFEDFGNGKSRLGFSSLSTGERLFVICFMANKLKLHVTVCREIAQLDIRHLKMFFELWANSKYIDVIIPSNLIEFQVKEIYNRVRTSNIQG